MVCRGIGLTRTRTTCLDVLREVQRSPYIAERFKMSRVPATAGCLALVLLLLAAAAAADSSGVILAAGAIAGNTCLAQPIDFGANSFLYQASVSLLTSAAVASGCLK